MEKSGIETVSVFSLTNLTFEVDKSRTIKATQDRLIAEGKEIDHIEEGFPSFCLGGKTQEIRIFWRIPNKSQAKTEQVQVVNQDAQKVVVTSDNFSSIIDRIDLFLEDEDWDKVKLYCESALDYAPKNADIYVRYLLQDLRLKRINELENCEISFESNDHYIKAVRFASAQMKEQLEGYAVQIKQRNENKRLSDTYEKANISMNNATSESQYRAAADLFNSIKGYKKANSLAKQCIAMAENCRKDAIYLSAKSKMNIWEEASYNEAITLFETILDWKDSDEQICACRVKIEEIKEQKKKNQLEEERKAAEKLIEKKKNAKKMRRFFAIACVGIVLFFILKLLVIPSIRYNNAVALINDGNSLEAARVFSACGNYKDARLQANKLWDTISRRNKINGSHHSVGILNDGTVVQSCTSRFYDFTGWEDIVEVTAGASFGLKSNGKIVYNPADKSIDSDIISTVGKWTNICSIAYSGFDCNSPVFGVKVDGTVVVAKDLDKEHDYVQNCDVTGWKDIISVKASCADMHSVGLKSDGTVVATGDNRYGQCNVSDWKNIGAIDAGSCHTVGLKSDGTVVAAGDNRNGQCNVSDWKDIVAIATGWDYTVGLKMDGTVVMVGDSRSWTYDDMTKWENIVAIYSSSDTIFGVKEGGTVVATGTNDEFQCNVGYWSNITVIDPRD